MAVPTEAKGGGNVIDRLIPGQIFYAQRNDSSGLIVIRMGEIRGKSARIDAHEGDEAIGGVISSDRDSIHKKARIHRFRAFAAESEQPLLDGKYQHPQLAVGNMNLITLPIRIEQLTPGDFYILMANAGKDRVAETVAKYEVLDPTGYLRFSAYDENTELRVPIKVPQKHIGRNPNLPGVVTMYPAEAALRRMLQAA